MRRTFWYPSRKDQFDIQQYINIIGPLEFKGESLVFRTILLVKPIDVRQLQIPTDGLDNGALCDHWILKVCIPLDSSSGLESWALRNCKRLTNKGKWNVSLLRRF